MKVEVSGAGRWRLMSLTQALGRQRHARGKCFKEEDAPTAAGKPSKTKSELGP